MPKLLVHSDAYADLDAIFAVEPDAADDIEVFLEEAAADPTLLDLFSAQDHGRDRSDDFHVARWEREQHQGRNLWRLKRWDLESIGLRCRVVYACDAKADRYYVPGVFDRDWDYRPRDARTLRVEATYDRIGIAGP